MASSKAPERKPRSTSTSMPGLSAGNKPRARHCSEARPRDGDDFDDGMGAGFDQVHAPQLGVGAARLAFRDPAKVLGIGGGIIDVFQGAIDGHQAQAKGESPWCVFGSQRDTRLLKEAAQEAHAELFARDRVQAARVGSGSGSSSASHRSA